MFLGLHIMARGQTSGYDYYYWFDNDASTLQKGHADGRQWLVQPDISQMGNQLHWLNVQVADDNGRLSQPVRRIFLKVGDLNAVKGYWWIDGNNKQVSQSANWKGAFDIDVSHLTNGMHTFYYQVRNNHEILSQPVARHFIKIPVNDGIEQMRAFYWFDNETEPREVSPVQGLMEIDASELNDGVHAFRYQMMQRDSTFSSPITRFFVKTGQGNTNAVTEYRYWLNDQVESQGKRVLLSEQKNPLELVTMLQPASQPLRSKSFYFEMTDGQPTVYPVNDLHLRFYDVNKNHTDTVARYADLSAGQRVSDITLLQSGVRETTARPVENAIKWYKLEASAGDELKFRLSAAATFQLFAPSGDEVLNIEGKKDWSEVEVWERGIYYAALHDVTDEDALSLSIDYVRTQNAIEGDVNADGSVDIGDIVMVISVMTGTETDDAIVARADVNSDGAADIGDIVSIIGIMTNQPAGARAYAANNVSQQESNDHVSMKMHGRDVQLSLNNALEYTAFQLLLSLPEGTTVDNVAINSERSSGHVVAVEPTGDGQYLIMGYSLGNKPLKGCGGTLLNVETKGIEPEYAFVDNAVFANTKSETFHLTGGETTGIKGSKNSEFEIGNPVYDLQGRRVRSTKANSSLSTIHSSLKKGIYLVGNRKVAVK